MKILKLAGLAAAVVLAGCITVRSSETAGEVPVAEMPVAPEGREVAVHIAGFEVTLTSYLPVYGYETVWRDRPTYRDRYGRIHGGGMHSETYSTTTYVPQTTTTAAFAERARDRLENAGFVVGATNAAYVVEVRFTGPVVTDGDRAAKVAWLVCSLLTADHGAQTWNARLRVSDANTGKVLMHRDYSRKSYATVWGPIPILSPAAATATDYEALMTEALAWLTDCAVADAAEFMVGR